MQAAYGPDHSRLRDRAWRVRLESVTRYYEAKRASVEDRLASLERRIAELEDELSERDERLNGIARDLVEHRAARVAHR